MPEMSCMCLKFNSFSKTRQEIAEAGIIAKATAITNTIKTLDTAFSWFLSPYDIGKGELITLNLTLVFPTAAESIAS